MKKNESKILQIRLSIDAYKKIESDAQASGLKVSEHARQIILSNKGVSLLAEEAQEQMVRKEEELNRKYDEAIEGEAVKFLHNAIADMDFLTFVSLRSFLKKLKKKKGAAAIEAVLALAIILPILFSFIFGGYNYYLKQADNVNINFEVGRFYSVLDGCNETQFRTISGVTKFNRYNLITVIDSVEKQTYTSVNPIGTIAIYCVSAS